MVQVLLSRQDVDINMSDEVCPSQWKWTLSITHVTACSCSSEQIIKSKRLMLETRDDCPEEGVWLIFLV